MELNREGIPISRLVEEKLAEAKIIYKQGRVILAYLKIREAEKLIDQVGVEYRSFVFDRFRANSYARKIIRAGEASIILLETMQNKLKWRPSNKTSNIEVSTNLDEEAGKYHFKVEDLYASWMPFCIESQDLGEGSTPYKRTTKCQVDFTFARREALILSLVEELPNGDLYLYLKSFEAEDVPQTAPRMELEGGFLFHDIEDKQVSHKQTRIRPNMPYCIPNGRIQEMELVNQGNIKLPSLLPSSVLTPAVPSKTDRLRPWFRDMLLKWIPSSGSRTEVYLSRSCKSDDQHRRVESDSTDLSFAQIETETSKTRRMLVTATFRVDPKFSFLPDWVLYTSLKSSAYTVLTMLDWQAKLFQPGSIYHSRLADEKYSIAKQLLLSRKGKKS